MNIAVVGSGMTGVSALLDFHKRTYCYNLGFLCRRSCLPVEVGNEDLDRFYHHINTGDNYNRSD